MSLQWVPLYGLKTPVLQENFDYLLSRQHELASLLQSSHIDESLELRQAEGFIVCRRTGEAETWIFGRINPRAELAALQDRIRALASNAPLIILVGAAGGYALAGLIPRLLREENLRVVVIEPSAARILLSLAIVDARAALTSERLHFAIAKLEPEAIVGALESFNLANGQPFELFISPEFENRIDADPFRKDIQDKINHSVQFLGDRLQGLAKTSEVSETIRRALIVNCWQGVAGGVHLNAIRKILAEWGVETRELVFSRHRIDAAPIEHRRLAEKQVLDAFERFSPDLVLSYGYHAPQFVSPEVFESLKAHWVQAVSNLAYYDKTQYPGELTVLIEENLIPIFQRRGYKKVLFLPIMADYVLDAPIQNHGSIPIIFVGNSLAMGMGGQQEFWNRWRGRDALVAEMRNAEAQLSDFNLQDNFYDYFHRNFFSQVETEDESYAIFRYLLCMTTAARRTQVLEALSPLGLRLYGGDWEGYLPIDSPLRSCLQGYLPMQRELEAFAHGRIFVNIHSVGHVNGTNMRYFNTGGVGAFQISDGPQHDRFLAADREAVYASSVSEFVEKTRYYLNHSEERDAIRIAAHERVKKDWTYRNWLRVVFTELGVSAPQQPPS